MKKKIANTFLILLIIVCNAVSMYEPPIIYDDVKRKDWFYEYIVDVHKKGYMTGYDAYMFGAYDNLLRGQFASVLWNLAGNPESTYDGRFPDVSEEELWAEAAMWTAQNGIITGDTHTGEFSPQKPITREQLATMLYRYANYIGADTSAETNLDYYSDANQVAEYAWEAMEWCIARQFMVGETINPKGNVSRADCAYIISLFTTQEGLNGK